MDRRRRQWVPLGVNVAHGRTGPRLIEKFGRDGLLVWILYLAACKANPIQGQFSYTSEADGWTKLGLYGEEPDFTLAEFFALTGRLKKTRQTRAGRITHVINTRWGQWNDVVQRDLDSARSARKRAQNTRTKDGLNEDREESENERESESDQQQDLPALPTSAVDDASHASAQPRGRARNGSTPSDPAAAAQAPSDTLILDACRRFGADRDIVFPLAELTTAEALHEITAKVERKIASNRVDDVPALFVHLLQRAPRPAADDEPAPITPANDPEHVERATPEQAVELNVRRFVENGRDWPTIQAFVADAFPADLLELARTVYDDATSEPAQETAAQRGIVAT